MHDGCEALLGIARLEGSLDLASYFPIGLLHRVKMLMSISLAYISSDHVHILDIKLYNVSNTVGLDGCGFR